jgi:DNA-binding response OmpR family regulator
MTISVILLQKPPDQATQIKEALSRIGIRVTCVHSISRMHVLFTSRHFDALIVSQELMDLYRIIPSRHLWDFRSFMTIFVYTVEKQNSIRININNVQEKISGKPKNSEKLCIEQTIESALISAGSNSKELTVTGDINHLESGERVLKEMEQEVTLPVDIAVHLHKKIRVIYQLLRQAGTEGAHPDMISNAAWGNTVRDRKKDIQIYISRLRGILALRYRSRYQILLVDKRYILVDRLQA